MAKDDYDEAEEKVDDYSSIAILRSRTAGRSFDWSRKTFVREATEEEWNRWRLEWRVWSNTKRAGFEADNPFYGTLPLHPPGGPDMGTVTPEVTAHLGHRESPSARLERVDEDVGLANDLSKGESRPEVPAINLPIVAGSADIQRILELLPAPVALEVAHVIVSPSRYEAIGKLIPREEREVFDCKLPPGELKRLLEVGMLERVSQSDIEFWCNVFTIVEAGKGKCRLIIEPRDLNKHFKYWSANLPNIENIIELLRKVEWLYQIDLACFFYQIPLSKEVSSYFGVMIDGVSYRLKCLPMGFVASVFVSQQIAALITKPASLGKSMNYIDNIFGGEDTRDEAIAEMRGAIKRATDLRLLVKIKSLECGVSLTILGINCNASDQTVCLSQAFVDKHRYILSIVSQYDSMVLTARAGMRILGVLCRTVYVLRIPYFNLPLLLKAASELATVPIDTVIHFTFPEDMKAVAVTGLSNTPVDVKAKAAIPTSDCIIVTDASLVGYGIILMQGTRIFTCSGLWTDFVDSMPMREAQAFLIGLELARAKKLRVRGATWYTDSLTVLGAAARGHSGIAPINEVAKFLTEWSITGYHIPSLANPADTMSKLGSGGLTQEDKTKLDSIRTGIWAPTN